MNGQPSAGEADEPLINAEQAQAQPALPRPYVTQALISVNAMVFGYMLFAGGFNALWMPDTETVLKLGANFGPLTASGEYWRVITCMFVHIGLLHIGMNMWVLSDVGQVVETLFGPTKFFLIYMLAGAAGSLNSLYWNPLNISAGASGAVFGVFGALLAYFWIHRKHYPPNALKVQSQRVLFLILFNLLYGASSPAIDNSAHIGGLIGGFMAGFCMVPAAPWLIRWRFVDIVRTALLVVAIYAFGKVDMQRIEANPEVKTYQLQEKSSGVLQDVVPQLKNNKYKEALDICNQALKINPDDARAYSYRAVAYRGLQQFQKAIEDCTQAIVLDPRAKFAFLVRAETYHSLNRTNEAINDLNQALKIDPKMAAAWNSRAWTLASVGNYKQAADDARKAVELQPDMSIAYDTLGVAYSHQKQYQKALEALNRALSIDKGEAAAYYHRSYVFLKTGLMDRARQDRLQARKLGYVPEAWEVQADR